MGDSSTIVVERDGKFLSSYLATGPTHETGPVLRQHYATLDLAHSLIDLGDLFCLGENPAVGQWPEFCNTLTYWNPPRTHDSMESVWVEANANWSDKVYWFRDGKWRWVSLLGRREDPYESFQFKTVRKPRKPKL